MLCPGTSPGRVSRQSEFVPATRGRCPDPRSSIAQSPRPVRGIAAEDHMRESREDSSTERNAERTWSRSPRLCFHGRCSAATHGRRDRLRGSRRRAWISESRAARHCTVISPGSSMKARTPSAPSAASAIRSAPGEGRVARARGEKRVDALRASSVSNSPTASSLRGAHRPPRLRPRCMRQSGAWRRQRPWPGLLPGAGRTLDLRLETAAGSTRSTTPQASNRSAGRGCR